MWWGLIVSLVFVYVYRAIEMVEEWRLSRSAEKELTQMRMHAASGHRWDVTRGQWMVEGTSSHLSSPWRMPTLAASLAPGKPRIWPLVQLF
jgi:hypothetical protein